MRARGAGGRRIQPGWLADRDRRKLPRDRHHDPPVYGRRQTITLKGHGNTISSLDFSPDGRRLASGSLDQTARIWDTSTGSSVAVLQGTATSSSGSGSLRTAGRLLTYSEDGAIRLWETSSGVLLGSLRGQAGVRSIHMSRDGQVVAVGDMRGTVRIWDLDRTIRRGVLSGHTSFVYDVAITTDGRWVASSFVG